jgi:Lrp/AsnC family transcriptional regulator for asnA, asnC and gidA
MDKLDYLILSDLLKDAQMSFTTIAKKLGVSPHTVRKRYQKMKQEGIIIKSIASINLAKLGYQGKALLMITNSPSHDKATTIAALAKIKNIIVVTEIIGPFDILAIAPVTDLKNIKLLADETRKLPSVQRVEITCITETTYPLNPSFCRLLRQKCLEEAAASPKP